MKPDYEYSDKCHIRFFNCDNMEFMKEIPDNYYELCICDPPYSINAPKMSANPCQRKVGSKRLNGGSMTIARACYEEEFDLDIMELDKEYFDKGVHKFKEYVSQIKLF